MHVVIRFKVLVDGSGSDRLESQEISLIPWGRHSRSLAWRFACERETITSSTALHWPLGSLCLGLMARALADVMSSKF
jgi:hypothetical protein